MKILTLNLHCFAEEELQRNQDIISTFIAEEEIDVVFFQEVSQFINSPVYEEPIKKGNYGLEISNRLEALGYSYDYYYDYGNQAFGNQEEGLAILSKTRLGRKESFYVSRETSYDKYWTRKIVKASIKYNNEVIDLISVHLGWTGFDEVFEEQVDELMKHVDPNVTTILAGDYNVSEDSKEYEYIINKNLYDLYYNGEKQYFHDYTHQPYIDVKKEAKRIDYVLSNKPFKTLEREIVFKDVQVSDHYGVYIEIEEE